MSSAQVKTTQNGTECMIHISGAIDDQIRFPVIEFGQARTAILELGGVKMLNSMGLRSWIEWIKGFKDRVQLVFRNCPRSAVDQMNILQGFLPRGSVVESFIIPYHCESCGHTEDYLATRGRDFMEATVDVKEGVVVKPAHPCLVCGQEAKWDIIPAKYFAFLKLRR